VTSPLRPIIWKRHRRSKAGRINRRRTVVIVIVGVIAAAFEMAWLLLMVP